MDKSNAWVLRTSMSQNGFVSLYFCSALPSTIAVHQRKLDLQYQSLPAAHSEPVDGVDRRPISERVVTFGTSGKVDSNLLTFNLYILLRSHAGTVSALFL